LWVRRVEVGEKAPYSPKRQDTSAHAEAGLPVP
jgi:hypothetical protein